MLGYAAGVQNLENSDHNAYVVLLSQESRCRTLFRSHLYFR